MKPFPNRTGTFQRIRLSLAPELSPESRLTVSITRKPFSILEAAQLWPFAL
jgi:hypothetical protein